MKNILITGGAGFIGSRLSLSLLGRGYKVTVLDTLSPQIHTDDPEQSELYLSIKDKVNFIRGDVTSRDDLVRALAGQQVVVHFAAETGTGQSMYQIERYSAVNVGGTALLLDLLANTENAVERVVIASSRSVYGEGKYLAADGSAVYPTHRAAEAMSAGDFEVRHPGQAGALALAATDEESKIHPSSVYGITKQVQEQLVMTVCPSIGIVPVAFRYQNVYGPGQSLSNPYTGILSIFSNLIMQGRPINIFEDGLESRDFVFVDDVVAATVLGIEKDEAANQVFNVGSGQAVDVMTVARTLCRKLGIEVPISVSGNFRIGDIRHNYACLDKIGSLLGYRPAYDFERGISAFCAWAANTGAVESAYDESLREMRDKGLLK
ncbi:MAG: NAD-dependent epimerase/dehydratase family protein [Pseudomonadota bacterium]